MSEIKENFTTYGTYYKTYDRNGTISSGYYSESNKKIGVYYYDDSMSNISFTYWERKIFRVTTIGSDTDGDKISSASLILTPKLTIKVGAVNGDNTKVKFSVGICTSKPDNYSEETLYNRSASTLKTVETTGSETIEITDISKSQAENILRYGVVLSGVSTSTNAYASVLELSFEVGYISIETPPVIEFVDDSGLGSGNWNGFWINDDGSASWRHRIEDPVAIKLKYTQEANAALSGYKVWYTPLDAEADTDTPTQGETVVVYEKELPDAEDRITIPTSIWRGLTRQWRGAATQWQYARVRIWGISATDKLSNMLEMQMWIQLSPHVIDAPARDSIQTTNSAVKLEWSPPAHGYQGFMGSVPSGFRIDYSTDGGAVWNILSDEIGGDTYTYTIPAETMESGTFDWRIVAKYVENTYTQPIIEPDEMSRFLYKTNPKTSTVECDGKPQPTITWESAEQKSYQVRFGDYDSGAVYSAEKSHTIPRFFADGNYRLQVRTQVASGEWSGWTEEIYVAIKNTAPQDTVSLDAVKEGLRVKTTWNTVNAGAFVRYILYRNGIPIYDTDGAKQIAGYMDNTAIGFCTYFVRGITSDKNYAQSNSVSVDATPDTDIIYDVQSGEYVRLRYTISAPTTITYSTQIGVSYQYFAGRNYPVAIVDGKKERTTTQTYGSKYRDLPDRIEGMVGREVLFKDKKGGGMYGIIEQAASVHGLIHSVTFTMREVDKNERIEYTVPAA